MIERICTSTGLHLVEASGQRAYRVAKDRYGPLSVRRNEHVGPNQSIKTAPGGSISDCHTQPWAVSVDWQLERSIYQVRLPRQGWWVRIDHPDTLQALETLASATPDAMGEVTMLTATEVTGPVRDLTTLLANVLRQQTLDDGSQTLGIVYRSRTLTGHCWAS